MKFFIFNSVTAALFGIGIYADRRWKLRTTSLGVLIISILLVPLNVLAIAAFTEASPPTDFFSISGEILSLTIFGALTYFAGRTVVPNHALALGVGVMVPSVMQLLTRRFIATDTSYWTLYLIALVPVAIFWITTGSGLRRLGAKDEIVERDSNELFIFAGLVAFATVMPLGLFLYKVWDSAAVAHDMSPVLSLFAIPPMVLGIFSWRRLGEPIPALARISGIAIGLLGVFITIAAVFFAWPNPATLLPTTAVPGFFFLACALFWDLPVAYFGVSTAALATWPLLANVWRGAINWRAGGEDVTNAMLSAATGNLLMPLLGVMAAGAVLLARRGREAEARVVGSSTGVVAVVCLALVTWFGFGQAGDPYGVTWTYAAIAIALYAAATWMNHRELAWAAVSMIFATVVQAMIYRWPVAEPWLTQLGRAGLMHASVCTAAVIVVGIGSAYATRRSERVQTVSLEAALISSAIAAAILVFAWFRDTSVDVLFYFAWLTLIWFALAIARNRPKNYAAFQVAFAATTFFVAVRWSRSQPWFDEATLFWLQSQFLQVAGILLSGYCLLASCLRWLLPSRVENRSTSTLNEAEWTPTEFLRRWRQLIHAETSRVDHVVAIGVVLVVTWLACYAAAPGVAQELAPRERVANAVPRIVPPIASFEMSGVPSLPAASYLTWALLAAAVVIVLVRSRQWTSGGSKLLLLFLFALACPLFSARWLAEVSVASALRWSLAIWVLAASIPMWWRSRLPTWCRKYIVPLTNRRVGGEVNVAEADSLSDGSVVAESVDGDADLVRETTAAHGVLFATVTVPYLLMAFYVGAAALKLNGLPDSVLGILPMLGLVAAFAGLALVVTSTKQDNAANRENSAPERLAATTRTNSSSKVASAASPNWTTHIRSALAFAAIGPPLVAIMFAVAAALMRHPIVGPEPGSWFRTVGWSVAYTVPVLLMAVAVVGHAIRERSAIYAFGAGILFQVAATAGFMLALPRMGRGLDLQAWINVAQVNAIVSSTVSTAWLAYLTFADQRRGSRARRGRAIPTLLTSYVVLAASLLLVTLLPALGRIWFDPVPPVWATAVGGAFGWSAFISVSAAIMFWRWTAKLASGTATNVVLSGVGIFSSVIIVAATAARWDFGNWLSFHTIEFGFSIGVGIIAALRWRQHSTIPERETVRSLGTTQALKSSYLTFAMIAVVFALRGALSDDLAEWWSVGTVVWVSICTGAMAWKTERRVLIFAAGWLWSLSSSLWWLIVPLGAHPGGFFEVVLDFIYFNIVMTFVPVLFSLTCTWRDGRNQHRAKSLLTYHGFALSLGCLFFGLSALVGLVADWNGFSLANNGWLGVAAWTALIVGAIGWYALWRGATSIPILYLIGLLGVAQFQDRMDSTGPVFWWTATMLLAAYGLATSYLCCQRASIDGLLTRWLPSAPTPQLPATAQTEPVGWLARFKGTVGISGLVAANSLLAAVVVLLVGWIDLTFDSLSLRVPASHAVLAQAVSIGLLARGTTRTPLQYAALLLGAFFAVVFGWSWLQPQMEATVLHHAVVVVVAVSAVALAYAFGLIRFVRLRNEWVDAAERVVPVLVAICAAALIFVSSCEVWDYFRHGEVPMKWAAIVAISIALVAVCAACLAAALLPGRDPLGLSESRRQVYVYVAEAVLALLGMHIRLTMPWLFHGWFTRFWPLIAMGIAFLGVGIGELMQRRRQRVLADPLVTTGALLPVLPVLSFWILPSDVNYSLTLLATGALYATLATLRKSFAYAILATVAANGSLWYLLHQVDGLDFVKHPKLWLVPPALCVLVASHLCRRQLTHSQLTAMRYASAIVLYVASTADVFITGVGNAPWLPLVLAGLSIAGIFGGIMLRVRAFLYLGFSFLLVSLLTIIWYAAVEREMTWIWWVSGIITGILIIALFAVFEKRRDDMLKLVDSLRTWES